MKKILTFNFIKLSSGEGNANSHLRLKNSSFLPTKKSTSLMGQSFLTEGDLMEESGILLLQSSENILSWGGVCVRLALQRLLGLAGGSF